MEGFDVATFVAGLEEESAAVAFVVQQEVVVDVTSNSSCSCSFHAPERLASVAGASFQRQFDHYLATRYP